MRLSAALKPLGRWFFLVVLCAVGLQLFFILRIASMRFVDPGSTAFQRSEAWRIASSANRFQWRQAWIPAKQHSVAMKRAVIASEDDVFATHGGVQWDALEKAWSRNARAMARAQARAQAQSSNPKPAKLVGGSTITQQLAKNLFLSGERTLLRKGQEFVLTLLLEALLSKQRILEIYLNSVEWGEGVFGAEAAAQHYFRKPAAKLTALEAARLAVMLPRPRYFEKLPNSGYLAERAAVIVERLPNAQLP